MLGLGYEQVSKLFRSIELACLSYNPLGAWGGWHILTKGVPRGWHCMTPLPAGWASPLGNHWVCLIWPFLVTPLLVVIHYRDNAYSAPALRGQGLATANLPRNHSRAGDFFHPLGNGEIYLIFLIQLSVCNQVNFQLLNRLIVWVSDSKHKAALSCKLESQSRRKNPTSGDTLWLNTIKHSLNFNYWFIFLKTWTYVDGQEKIILKPLKICSLI